jgi:cob(I)alamin adenosyltransferase
MKIYTKTGDGGKTSLVEGTRISKSDLRIEAYGTVDELNSFLGLVADHDVNKARYDFLKSIQDNLFVIGANLASDPSKRADKVPPVQTEDIIALEKSMDEMDSKLPELKHFILPGGHVAVSLAHVCRTICRRAERCVVRLSEADEVPELVATYLNRLSDFFFVLSRMMSLELGVQEVKWVPRKS